MMNGNPGRFWFHRPPGCAVKQCMQVSNKSFDCGSLLAGVAWDGDAAVRMLPNPAVFADQIQPLNSTKAGRKFSQAAARNYGDDRAFR